MTHLIVLGLAGGIGVIAGMRALTAPAVIAWAALLRWVNFDGTWVQWLAHPVTVAVLTVAALGELVVDLRPGIGNRTDPLQFLARIVAGAFAAAALGTAWNFTWTALGAGMIGAVAGAVGGLAVRRRFTAANHGRDLPVALLEDVTAVLGGLAVAALTAVI